MNSEATGDFKAKLSGQLLGVFDGAAEAQRRRFEAHPETRPQASEVDGIISYYSNLNAGISGALSLVPGPLGMAAAIPEILLVIRNQVKMVYEIGVAYDKDEVLTRELLLGITMSAAGVGTIGLVAMHGSKVIVKRASLRVLQKMVGLLAGKITQQVLKSMVAKWVPFLGAAAIAVWTRYTTASIGRTAKQVLQLDITVEHDDVADHDMVVEPAGLEERIFQKILVLSNLAKADGHVADVERAFIMVIIDNAPLTPDERETLRTRAAAPDLQSVDLTVFKEDDAVALLMDLVALANQDGVLHSAEKLYIRHIARKLPLQLEDVESLLSPA